MTTKTKKPDLIRQFVSLGESLVKSHIEIDDGERCFNLYLFIDALDKAIYGSPIIDACGQFELNTREVARLVFCHMAISRGDDPGGDTFRGMPILD